MLTYLPLFNEETPSVYQRVQKQANEPLGTHTIGTSAELTCPHHLISHLIMKKTWRVKLMYNKTINPTYLHYWIEYHFYRQGLYNSNMRQRSDSIFHKGKNKISANIRHGENKAGDKWEEGK